MYVRTWLKDIDKCSRTESTGHWMHLLFYQRSIRFIFHSLGSEEKGKWLLSNQPGRQSALKIRGLRDVTARSHSHPVPSTQVNWEISTDKSELQSDAHWEHIQMTFKTLEMPAGHRIYLAGILAHYLKQSKTFLLQVFGSDCVLKQHNNCLLNDDVLAGIVISSHFPSQLLLVLNSLPFITQFMSP